jgi:hypothetical protein
MQPSHPWCMATTLAAHTKGVPAQQPLAPSRRKKWRKWPKVFTSLVARKACAAQTYNTLRLPTPPLLGPRCVLSCASINCVVCACFFLPLAVMLFFFFFDALIFLRACPLRFCPRGPACPLLFASAPRPPPPKTNAPCRPALFLLLLVRPRAACPKCVSCYSSSLVSL